VAAAQVVMRGNNSFEGVKGQIEEVVNQELENIDKFSEQPRQRKGSNLLALSAPLIFLGLKVVFLP